MARDAEADGNTDGQDIVVEGVLQKAISSSATGLSLTPKETPQSITILDRERVQTFALTNINDLLDQMVGINVERVETDRTQYNSRGFDITNFQVDGIGLPLISGIQFGDLDTILFDRVEAVRGANAIMTGIGNPSATINYVRKRPTADFHLHVGAQAGSWGEKRFEGDVSGPVNASGTLRARLIYAHEDGDSYLDYNHVDRDVYGAILAWDVTSDLKATVGYMRQQNDSRGVLWGALPLTYGDGTRIDYPVSASTSADWTYWNVRDQNAFAELSYGFGSGWAAKSVFTYKRFQEHAKLLYAYNYPDRDTGLGVAGMAGVYPSDYKQYLLDFYASGPFHLFGRAHQLAFGISAARSRGHEYEGQNEEDLTLVFPDYREWGRVQVAEPGFPDPILQSSTTDTLLRAYAAAHLSIADPLKAVMGVSIMKLKSTGISYGTDQSRDDSAASPYLSLLYEVTPDITLYASYTDIFNPQIEVDRTNRKLAPAKGTSIEAGIKSEWFEKRLYATAAVFRARQKGLATFAGTFGPDAPDGRIGDSFYTGVDTAAKGFEIELAGHITDQWTLSGGYTGIAVEDQQGQAARTFVPRRSLKLATTYTISDLRDLKLGAQMRWQSAISTIDSGVQDANGNDVVLRQGAYAVLDLTAGFRVVDHATATLNVRNVTRAKYVGSLMWGQAFYAAPRSFTVSLNFDY